jgi:hypothetical protein
MTALFDSGVEISLSTEWAHERATSQLYSNSSVFWKQNEMHNEASDVRIIQHDLNRSNCRHFTAANTNDLER